MTSPAVMRMSCRSGWVMFSRFTIRMESGGKERSMEGGDSYLQTTFNSCENKIHDMLFDVSSSRDDGIEWVLREVRGMRGRYVVKHVLGRSFLISKAMNE